MRKGHDASFEARVALNQDSVSFDSGSVRSYITEERIVITTALPDVEVLRSSREENHEHRSQSEGDVL
jgi:hypothetical protein